ncbi:MAG: TlpA disulfide reductase family protein [Acidobacteriaceae bacterium]|jgi:peroxiredoxin
MQTIPSGPSARSRPPVLCLLLSALLAQPPAAAQSPQPTTPGPATYNLIPSNDRHHAPDFLLTDLDGQPLTLSQYRGRVILLDFWAVDCGGCKIEIPWYVAFDKTYRAHGLQLIGIDMYGESPGLVRPFMVKAGMRYPVAIGNDALGAQYHVESMPLTLLIDREGRIALSHAGIVDRNKFEGALQQLLR